MLRKLYASLSYSNFANPKTTNFNTWVSNVLGHGDMLTSFSYSWVNVADPEEIKAEGIKTELEELRRKIDLYLNLKNTNEIESENDTAECKYQPLGKRASREDKYKLLEQIWNDYEGKITNIKLREISKIGAVIVNEFIKEKKGDSEKKEAPQETKSQEPAAATEPLRRSTRTKNKKKTNT